MSYLLRLPNWPKVLYSIVAVFFILSALNLAPILLIGGPGGDWLYIQPHVTGFFAVLIGLVLYSYGAARLLNVPLTESCLRGTTYFVPSKHLLFC